MARMIKEKIPTSGKASVSKVKAASTRKSGNGTANRGVGVKQKRRGV